MWQRKKNTYAAILKMPIVLILCSILLSYRKKKKDKNDKKKKKKGYKEKTEKEREEKTEKAGLWKDNLDL